MTWLDGSIAEFAEWLGPIAFIELIYLSVKSRGNLRLARNIRRGAYIVFLISLGVYLIPALAQQRWLILEPLLLVFFLYVGWNEVPLQPRQRTQSPRSPQSPQLPEPQEAPEGKQPGWPGFS